MKTLSENVIDIGVCVPSGGDWKPGFGRCLAMQFAKFTGWRPEGIDVSRIRLFTKGGSMLVQNRFDLVKAALQGGCTHVLFLDDDMLFPDDLIQRLWAHKKDVVAANCTTRSFPVKEIAEDMHGKQVNSRKKHGLQKVRVAGLAVTLIRAEVFKHLTPPFFMMEWIPELKAYCGEDVYFVQKLDEIGVDTYVDHDISKEISHIGNYVYGHKDIGHNPPTEL